jgi:hypothetical protein
MGKVQDFIKGGKADKMSVEDIARKHSVFAGTIEKELEMGVKVEMEHTDNEDEAREIAMDHLVELPDYYTRLHQMEKEGEAEMEEPKEVTDAGSSGAFEPALSTPILKRDIQNFKLKKQEVDEVTGADVSAGAMYDAPIGTKKKDPLELDERPKSGSITAASTDNMIATKKGFPKFGGPDAKFVEIKPKCKKYPYCNQMSGMDNLTLYEAALHQAAKKYGLTIQQVQEIVIKESIDITGDKVK